VFLKKASIVLKEVWLKRFFNPLYLPQYWGGSGDTPFDTLRAGPRPPAGSVLHLFQTPFILPLYSPKWRVVSEEVAGITDRVFEAGGLNFS
jgi:hypothetical protein